MWAPKRDHLADLSGYLKINIYNFSPMMIVPSYWTQGSPRKGKAISPNKRRDQCCKGFPQVKHLKAMPWKGQNIRSAGGVQRWTVPDIWESGVSVGGSRPQVPSANHLPPKISGGLVCYSHFHTMWALEREPKTLVWRSADPIWKNLKRSTYLIFGSLDHF